MITSEMPLCVMLVLTGDDIKDSYKMLANTPVTGPYFGADMLLMICYYYGNSLVNTTY